MKNVFRPFAFSCMLFMTAVCLRHAQSFYVEPSYTSFHFYEKLTHGLPIKYIVIGDSIGRGSGSETSDKKWYKQMEKKVFRQYGASMKGDYVVQSGATAFEGLFKLQKKQPDNSVDVVFICFGENDRKYMKAHAFSLLYESLLRKAASLYPRAEIITFTESSLPNQEFAEAIEKISRHYNASNIDMRAAFQQSGMTVHELTKDNVHPNGSGYEVYANTIMERLKQHIQKHKKIAELKPPIHENSDMEFDVVAEFSEQKGFELEQNYLVSNKKGSYVEFHFYGSILGIKLLRSPDGGMFNVFIDGKFYTTMSTWWPFEKERYLYITSGLTNDLHTVRFEVTGEKSRYNVTNASVIRLSSIIMSKKIENK